MTLADKYGILLWDEFFQPNPSDGPNVTDIPNVHRECDGQGEAVSESSGDCGVVRAERGVSAEGDWTTC